MDSLSADGGDVVEKVMSQSAAITSRPEPEIPEEAQDALKQLELLRLGHDTGDVQIYAYYANIAGWWTISAYLLGCVTFVFGMTFPCTLRGFPEQRIHLLISLSCLVTMVG